MALMTTLAGVHSWGSVSSAVPGRVSGLAVVLLTERFSPEAVFARFSPEISGGQPVTPTLIEHVF